MKILLVEDDTFMSAALASLLAANHYAIALATDGQTGLEKAIALEYDLILLDLQIPKLDGINLCRQLRYQGYHKPILLLTAKDSNADIVAGLDAGADDYVIKPYAPEALLARIRALLRRSGESANPPSTLTWGELCLDLTSGKVTLGEQVIPLTATEYNLLELFLHNPNRIFSRNAILDRLWGFDDAPSERTIVTHVKDIRKKLKAGGLTEDILETIYGMGYRLKPAPKEAASGSRACFQTSPSDSDPPHAPLLTRGENSVKVPLPPIPKGDPMHPPNPPLGRGDFRNEGDLGGSGGLKTDPKIAATQADNSKKHTPSAEDIAPANRVLERFRDSYKKRVAAQIAVLEQANTALLAGSFDEQLQQAATHEAHKLAGSMATFGYPEGSKLGRAVEHLLMNDRTLTPDEVSRFSQLVAALQQELTKSPVTSTASPVPTVHNYRVLAIDDDATLMEKLLAQAQSWGIRLKVAPDLTTARSRIALAPPDAVLLDLSFPDTEEDGLMLLRELAQRTPNLPVIVFTGRDSLSDRLAVSRLGARQFLQKPATTEQIFQAITRVLPQAQTSDARVLIVDDDPMVLAALSALLTPWGLQVLTLTEPQRFWEVLIATEPNLVVLDVEMPLVSGLELCQVVRQDVQWGDLPILLVTAHTDAESLQQAFAAGADDFITKPVLGPELVTRVLSRIERTRSRSVRGAQLRIKEVNSD
ncbi:MAG: response regulator [Coleofasciculus sp. C3-bin4]|nr:response regulator [Coleofasciculus sp. C3-bin4]